MIRMRRARKPYFWFRFGVFLELWVLSDVRRRWHIAAGIAGTAGQIEGEQKTDGKKKALRYSVTGFVVMQAVGFGIVNCWELPYLP